MPRREPSGDTGVEVIIDRIRDIERELEDLKAFVAGKLPHSHAADGVSARAARVHLGTDQSISNSTWTKIQVDTVDDDPDGLFNSANNELDTDTAGWWIVTVGVGFAGDSGGSRRFAAIGHNGSRIAHATAPPSGAADRVSVSDLVKVSNTDSLEVQAWQDSGGSLTVQSFGATTWLSAAYLGSA